MIITKQTVERVLKRFREETIAKLAAVQPGGNFDLVAYDGDETLLVLDVLQGLVNSVPSQILLQVSHRG